MSNRGALIRSRNKLKGAIGTREPKRPIFRGLTGDGTGGDTRTHVRVADEPTRMYVRVDGRGVLEAVVSTNVPMRHDVPVYIGPTQENLDVYEILGINFVEMDSPGGYAYVPSHHWSHEFGSTVYGADDVVWINKEQFLPFLAAPTDPPSTDLYAYPGFYLYLTDWQYFPGGNTGDLTAYNPAAGLGKYILISIDAETNTLSITDGVAFAPFPPSNPATRIPTCPARHFPLMAVYLLNTTATITWANLYDVRLMVGGGVNTEVPGPHHLIDTITHDDTIAWHSPVEGDMILANANVPSQWDILAAPGAAWQLLRSTGASAQWNVFAWDSLAGGGGDMEHDHHDAGRGGTHLRPYRFVLQDDVQSMGGFVNYSPPWNSYVSLRDAANPGTYVRAIGATGSEYGSIIFLDSHTTIGNRTWLWHNAPFGGNIHLAGGDQPGPIGQDYSLASHPLLFIRSTIDGEYYEIGWSGSGGGIGAHNILSLTHGDSREAAVLRGAIIVGQVNHPFSTLEWTRLDYPGTRHHLQTDDLDVIWDEDVMMATTHWIGLGDASGYGTGEGRIAFYDMGLGRDVIANLDADVGVGTINPNIAGEAVAVTIESATGAPTLELSRLDDILPANAMVGVIRWYSGINPQCAQAQIDVVQTGYYEGQSIMEFWTADDCALCHVMDLDCDGATFYEDVDWAGGNVTYVPLGSSIQAYVDAAANGDTLVLASGQYIITSTITVDKQLNIYGQGNAGFLTAPVTAGHGTLISSVTDNITAFQISSDNVRIAHLSIYLTGAASKGVNTSNNLIGLVFTNIDVIVTCTGSAQGFTILGSDVVMRDLTFYVSSTAGNASGVMFQNNAATTQACVADCFNVTGTVIGTTGYAYAFACLNTNVAQMITLNLSNSVCKALAGTPLDIAVVSYSVTTNNAVVNAYLCTFDGDDWDAYQMGTNELNIGGSVLVNNTTFGTITYRAAMTSALGIFGTSLGVGVTAAATRLDIGAGAMTLSEMAAPGAGAANTCRLYCVDNAGKTELYAIFATGAAQLIAAEP